MMLSLPLCLALRSPPACCGLMDEGRDGRQRCDEGRCSLASKTTALHTWVGRTDGVVRSDWRSVGKEKLFAAPTGESSLGHRVLQRDGRGVAARRSSRPAAVAPLTQSAIARPNELVENLCGDERDHKQIVGAVRRQDIRP